MEYGIKLDCQDDKIINNNFMRHVGYNPNNICQELFFSKRNVNMISKKVTELLQGVDIQNRNIIVPDNTINQVMSSVYNNFSPKVGDIFTRYNIPGKKNNNNQTMIDMVINIITRDVRNNLGMIECNSKLSKWTTLLGDFNEHNLRSHSKIKLREKRPTPMQFHMRY